MPVEVTRRKVPQKTDRRLRSVRVKRCGKSAPASRATGAARQTPPGARSRRERAVRPQTLPGRPHRWMVIHGPARRSRTEPRLQVDSPPPPYKYREYWTFRARHVHPMCNEMLPGSTFRNARKPPADPHRTQHSPAESICYSETDRRFRCLEGSESKSPVVVCRLPWWTALDLG